MEDTKKCIYCKLVFPRTPEYFNRNRSRYDGLANCCKKCHKEITRRNDKRRLAEGKCVNCSQERVPGSTRYCKEHWFKSISKVHFKTDSYWKELMNIAEKQNYICPYSGEKLIPGSNMSLDHIVPVSKRSDLATDLNNIQWVTKEINRFKSIQSHDNFLRLCKLVYQNNKWDQ